MRGRGARAGIGIVAALAFVLLLLPAAAQADYEQMPEHFGSSGEAAQLQNAESMAINVGGTGLGAGQAGSIYVVGRNNRVLRFTSGKEGEEPSFREAWGWGAGSGAEGAPGTGYQRCGPALVTEPAQHTFHACRPAEANAPFGGEEIGHFEYPTGVAVDQATGDVYVLNIYSHGHRENHLVEVFTATGTPIGEGFGEGTQEGGTPEHPAPAESIAMGPAKLHSMFFGEAGLAVNEVGTVYVTDHDRPNIAKPPGESRVMCFKPQSAGNYEHYEYCGQGKDIVTANSVSQWFTKIALVGGNRLVAGSREAIREYALAPGAEPQDSEPLCSATPEGVLQAMAANPVTGEVFYFSNTERKLYRLGACNPGTGSFESLQKAVTPTPKTGSTTALAVNPGLAWGPLRPAGVLYMADPNEHKEHGGEQLGIGDVFAPAKGHALPTIESESVTATGTESSTLRAEIDPHGFGTRFRFEYLDAATYAAQRATAEGEGKGGEEAEDAAFAGGGEAPLGGAPLGGEGVGTATTAIGGLDPDTEYAFRAIASSECEGEVPPNSPCEAAGKAAFFRTYAAAAPGLPDGRAYELVSPAQKNGGEVFPADPGVYSCPLACKPPGGGITTVFPMQSAPDGDAVTYMGFPFSPTEGTAVWNDYLSRRTAAGWQTTAMSPALQATKETAGNAFGTLAYDSSLSHDLLAQREPALTPQAPADYANLYEQGAADPGSLTPLLSTSMFASGHPPNRTERGFKLEYAGHSADFTRQFFAANDALIYEVPGIGVLPDPTSVGRDLYESHDGSLALLNVAPGNASVLAGASFASQGPDTHAISESGDRVYFQAGGTLYVREDGELTREVLDPGHFLTASTDGSKALLSDGCLYDLEGEACEDLTEYEGEHEGGFRGIAGADESLSRIYFVDTAVLSEEENEYGAKAQAGQDNLYLWEAGAEPRFVATLLGTDGAGGFNLGDWVAEPGRRTAEASPDGKWLAFASTAPLTGYANFGPTCINGVEPTPGYCNEAFLYDAATGRLSCASCNPTGEAPRGNSTLRRIGGSTQFPWLPQPRYLTDSGRLFFDSADRLLPLDTNGRVEDVYEFEPGGVGSCGREAGCVSLISRGAGSVDSNLLAVDETGANVFFTTRERLVPADTDELLDLYDARQGGGIAAETETQRGECQGEACQPSPAPPASPTPGSSSFAGAGNLREEGAPHPAAPRRPCAKGRVRRHGECTKRSHKRHRAKPGRGGRR
jgi:DNA-binding beta-propeller fold protein YncE